MEMGMVPAQVLTNPIMMERNTGLDLVRRIGICQVIIQGNVKKNPVNLHFDIKNAHMV